MDVHVCAGAAVVGAAAAADVVSIRTAGADVVGAGAGALAAVVGAGDGAFTAVVGAGDGAFTAVVGVGAGAEAHCALPTWYNILFEQQYTVAS